MKQAITPTGEVDIIVEHKNGTMEVHHFKNALLDKGRQALASSLANEIGDEFEFFINRMLFGDNGTASGVPKFVNSSRTGLFGVVRVNKPVIASIDPNNTSQVVFTSVISFDEGNGFTLNEMALQMANGDYYSMTTFEGIAKNSTMQLTWNWRLAFV